MIMKNSSNKKQIPYLKIILTIVAVIFLCVIGNFFWQKNTARNSINTLFNSINQQKKSLAYSIEDKGCRTASQGFAIKRFCQYEGNIIFKTDDPFSDLTTLDKHLEEQGWKRDTRAAANNIFSEGVAQDSFAVSYNKRGKSLGLFFDKQPTMTKIMETYGFENEIQNNLGGDIYGVKVYERYFNSPF